jgi:hypothetical protein
MVASANIVNDWTTKTNTVSLQSRVRSTHDVVHYIEARLAVTKPVIAANIMSTIRTTAYIDGADFWLACSIVDLT